MYDKLMAILYVGLTLKSAVENGTLDFRLPIGLAGE